MEYQAKYSQYNSMNKFSNLDSVETKVLEHLVYSTSKDAENFWKLLNYPSLTALSEPNLTADQKIALINQDAGYPTDKRVFLSPFIDDAWGAQCSSAYIFTEKVTPVDHTKSTVVVTVELVTHSKVAVVYGDGDPDLNENANPNDSNADGEVVVPIKNRETVLVKSILAELNGLYLDGIGYLQFNDFGDSRKSEVSMPLFNSRSFYGHTIKFVMEISGVSEATPVHDEDWC